MKNDFPNQDQAAQDASLSTPINTPRLPRETIPASNSELTSENAEPTGTRNAALGISLFVLAVLGMFSLGSWSARRSSQPPIVGPIANRVLEVKPVVVHVAGEVKKPGVYTLKNGARIFDALQKAGGASPKADTNALNLAALAQDGTKIEVPAKPRLVAQNIQNQNELKDAPTPEIPESDANGVVEFADSNSTKPGKVVDENVPFASASAAAQLPTKQPTKAATSSTRSATTAAKKREKPTAKKPRAKKEKSKTIAGLPRAVTPSGELSNNASTDFLAKNPLDLNRITQEQLEALPGVGPSLASRVLDYRKANGGFKSVDELDNVKGIGEKKLDDLRPLLRVEGETLKSKASKNESKSQSE